MNAKEHPVPIRCRTSINRPGDAYHDSGPMIAKNPKEHHSTATSISTNTLLQRLRKSSRCIPRILASALKSSSSSSSFHKRERRSSFPGYERYFPDGGQYRENLIFQKLVGFAHCHGIDTKIGSHLPHGGKDSPSVSSPLPMPFTIWLRSCRYRGICESVLILWSWNTFLVFCIISHNTNNNN